MISYLNLPSKKTWENLSSAEGYTPDGESTTLMRGPEGQYVVVIGDNYFTNKDGTREPRSGFLVNILGDISDALKVYAAPVAPLYPKSVFQGYTDV